MLNSSAMLHTNGRTQLIQNGRTFRNVKFIRQNRIRSRVSMLEGESDASISTEPRNFAAALAKVADETKCSDIVLLHVAPVASWTSYMMFSSVYSKPQLQAVMTRMEKTAEEVWGREKQNQPGSSPWEVLDFGDVVVHIMTPEQREYYDIESFYAACEEVDLPFTQDSESTLNIPSWSISF